MLHQTDNQFVPHISNREFKILRGWPGYRNRPGRSGLDYIDTCAEAGHVAGLLFRQLLTGEWLYPGTGIHPLAFLFGATIVLIGYVGPLICPAFMIGIFIAVNKSWKAPALEPESASVEEEDQQDETE